MHALASLGYNVENLSSPIPTMIKTADMVTSMIDKQYDNAIRWSQAKANTQEALARSSQIDSVTAFNQASLDARVEDIKQQARIRKQTADNFDATAEDRRKQMEAQTSLMGAQKDEAANKAAMMKLDVDNYNAAQSQWDGYFAGMMDLQKNHLGDVDFEQQVGALNSKYPLAATNKYTMARAAPFWQQLYDAHYRNLQYQNNSQHLTDLQKLKSDGNLTYDDQQMRDAVNSGNWNVMMSEGRSNEATKRLQAAAYAASVRGNQNDVDWIDRQINWVQENRRQRQPGEPLPPPIFNADGTLNPFSEGHLRQIEQRNGLIPTQAGVEQFPGAKMEVGETLDPITGEPKVTRKVTGLPVTAEARSVAEAAIGQEKGTKAAEDFSKALQADPLFGQTARELTRQAADQNKPAPTSQQVLDEYYKRGGTVKQKETTPSGQPVAQPSALPTPAARPGGATGATAEAIRAEAESMMRPEQVQAARAADAYRGPTGKMPADLKDARRVRDQIEERLRFPRKGASAQPSEQQLWNQMLADLEENPLRDQTGNVLDPNSALGQAALMQRWNEEHPALTELSPYLISEGAVHGNRGGLVTGYQEGGPVSFGLSSGYGSTTGTDSVPAMLTPGEFVVNRDAVQNVGADTLQAINQTGQYSAQQPAAAPPKPVTLDFLGRSIPITQPESPASQLGRSLQQAAQPSVPRADLVSAPAQRAELVRMPQTTAAVTTGPATLPVGGGGLNVTHFGYPSDPDWDSASGRGEGAYVSHMRPATDVALNKAGAAKVGATKPGQSFQYQGKTYRWADNIPELYPDARMDVFDPYFGPQNVPGRPAYTY
jgi:hypothetical protein